MGWPERILGSIVFPPIGYLYMRLRYGRYHKRKLIEKFDRDYYYAGQCVIWMPFLTIVIIISGWAVINVTIHLVKEYFFSPEW